MGYPIYQLFRTMSVHCDRLLGREVKVFSLRKLRYPANARIGRSRSVKGRQALVTSYHCCLESESYVGRLKQLLNM